MNKHPFIPSESTPERATEVAVLHEPDKPASTFVLTPDYDDTLIWWQEAYPERVHPRFTAEECQAFTFRWPGSKPRAANGRFVKT